MSSKNEGKGLQKIVGGLIRKFRFNRGPLRFWLAIGGLCLTQFDETRMLIGASLVGVGVLLHFVAKAYLRQNAVMTNAGPYRFSQSPFYVGNLIGEAGLLTIIGSPIFAAVYSVCWFLIYKKQIQFEQATVREIFGEEAVNYQAKVPWLIPVPWKFLKKSEVTGGFFNLKNPNIYGGREIQRVIRFASYPLMFLCADGLRAGGFSSLQSADSHAFIGFAGFVVMNVVGVLSTKCLRKLAPKPAEKSDDVGLHQPSELDEAEIKMAA